jgi:hypothetical protein
VNQPAGPLVSASACAAAGRPVAVVDRCRALRRHRARRLAGRNARTGSAVRPTSACPARLQAVLKCRDLREFWIIRQCRRTTCDANVSLVSVDAWLERRPVGARKTRRNGASEDSRGRPVLLKRAAQQFALCSSPTFHDIASECESALCRAMIASCGFSRCIKAIATPIACSRSILFSATHTETVWLLSRPTSQDRQA